MSGILVKVGYLLNYLPYTHAVHPLETKKIVLRFATSLGDLQFIEDMNLELESL